MTPEGCSHGMSGTAAGAVKPGERTEITGQNQRFAGGAQATNGNKCRKEDPEQDPLI